MNEADITLIERYLDDALSDADKQKVELRLKEDSEFAEQFDFIKDLKKSIAYSKKEDFKAKLNEIAENYKAENASEKPNRNEGNVASKRITKNNFRFYAVAAGLAAVFVSVVFFVLNNSGQSTRLASDKAYIQNFSDQNPESISLIEPQIFSTEKLQYQASKPDSLQNNSDLYSLAEIAPSIHSVLIIQNSDFDNAYFLSDTLYLFGDFNGSSSFFYSENNSNDVFLKKGMEYYKFTLNKTDSISPLLKIDYNSIPKTP